MNNSEIQDSWNKGARVGFAIGCIVTAMVFAWVGWI